MKTHYLRTNRLRPAWTRLKRIAEAEPKRIAENEKEQPLHDRIVLRIILATFPKCFMNKLMFSLFQTSGAFGPLLLRVFLAFVMFPHGAQRVVVGSEAPVSLHRWYFSPIKWVSPRSLPSWQSS